MKLVNSLDVLVMLLTCVGGYVAAKTSSWLADIDATVEKLLMNDKNENEP